MIQQAFFASYNNPLRVVDGADFDGTNDYMTRGADLTGCATGKTGILSFWVRFDGVINRTVLMNDTGNFLIDWIGGTGRVEIRGQNSSSTTILDTFTQTAFSSGAAWYHILCSWDLAVGIVRLYVNDVSDQFASPTATNDTINYPAVANWLFGYSGGVNRFSGCFADFYFAPNQYLDISLVANRRKFISASGKPVHLGATGSLPTGTAPIVYFHLDDGEAVANFATNRGTGGNFSITGSLDTASSSPSG